MRGEQGTVHFDSSTGVLKSFTVEYRNGDTTKLRFNQYEHRMASEFTDFVKIIDSRDTASADELYAHSMGVMDVLAQAKTSIGK